MRLAEIDLNPRTLAGQGSVRGAGDRRPRTRAGRDAVAVHRRRRAVLPTGPRPPDQPGARCSRRKRWSVDVLEAQAAPALAEAARNLGMIPSRTPRTWCRIPAGNWIVVGNPKPAEGVPPPPLNVKLPDDDAAPHAASGPCGSPPHPRRHRPGAHGAGVATAPVPPAPGIATAPVPPAPGADPEVAVPLDHAATAAGRGSARRPGHGSRCPVRPMRRRPGLGDSLPRPGRRSRSCSRGPRSRPGRRRSDAARRSWCPEPAGVSRRNDGRGPAPKKAGSPKRPAKQPEQQGHSARRDAPGSPSRWAREPRRSGSGTGPATSSSSWCSLSPRRSCSTCRCRARPGCAPRPRDNSRSPMSRRRCAAAIVDRNFDKLAFTIEARALTFQPIRIRKQLAEAREKSAEAPDPQQRLRDIAREVSTRLDNRPDMATVLKKLKSDDTFVYLARAVDPAVANAIIGQVPRGRRRTSGPAPVSRRVVGGQHGRRHRLGRPRAARARGLAGLRRWPAPTGRSPTTAAPTAW